jgi:hypothetical protein
MWQSSPTIGLREHAAVVLEEVDMGGYMWHFTDNQALVGRTESFAKAQVAVSEPR